MTMQTQIRCCGCSRLLFKMEANALSGVLSIRCHRCKAMNILRPVRALPDERLVSTTERPIDKGSTHESFSGNSASTPS